VKKSKRDSKLPSTPRSKKPVGVGGININTSSSESCPSAKPASPHINSAASKKLNKINAILSQPEIDLWALRELCLTEGGLINGKQFRYDILNCSFVRSFLLALHC
jgi:hypothetical protein